MLRLVYVSTCSPTLTGEDVVQIARDASLRNERKGISGMLCWSGEFFLQCLEGERRVVSELFAKISVDKRHTDLEIIIAAPTNVRWFNQWGMGYSRLMASTLLDLPALRGEPFNPYLLQATDLEATFERLSQLAQRLSVE